MTKCFILPKRRGECLIDDVALLQLVCLLRYGTASPDHSSSPILNLSAIAKAVGVSRAHTSSLLKRHFEVQQSDSEPSCKKRKKLSLQHVQFLTSSETLNAWAHFSLKERAIMFHRQHPEINVSASLIRRLYKNFKISFKKIRRTKPPIRIQDGYYGELFRQMVINIDRAHEQGLKFFYLDETVFSFSTFASHTWSHRFDNISIPENAYKFKTQAVIAAVSE